MNISNYIFIILLVSNVCNSFFTLDLRNNIIVKKNNNIRLNNSIIIKNNTNLELLKYCDYFLPMDICVGDLFFR